jgi:tetratricopeptide (TPR) repeat protein
VAGRTVKGEIMEREQSQKDKSLAWFKLADLIARGEREKALNVFRLLAHSLPDRAYVLQLEGDILWYLDDKNSTEKYKQAAFLYQREKRWVDAIALYEHLLTQTPDSYDILAALLIFYAMIDWYDKFNERYHQLVHLFNNHIIDEFQLEKAVKDVVDVVAESEYEQKNTWFWQWFDSMLIDMPEVLATRLSALKRE